MKKKTQSIDINSLSKEEKLKLIDLLEAKKRKQLNKKDRYIPNKGQLPIHQSKATVRFCASGNGMGKTTAAAQEAMWRAQGYNPVTKEYTQVPAKIAVVLDKPEKVESVWIPEIRKWFSIEPDMMKKKGKPYISQINFTNGSELTFYFHDQDPLSFESIEVDFVVFDEPPPRHVYIGMRRGGRRKGYKASYLIIGTPLAAAWLRTDIWEPWAKGELEDVECFRASSEVNKENLQEGFIEGFSKALTDKERQIRLHGEFYDLEGLALSHLFRRETHIVPRDKDWNKEWPCVVAIDPHPSKNHIALLLGASRDGHLYVLKELSRKAVAKDFAAELKKWYEGFRIIDIVVDSLGSSEMTGGEGFLSFIQVLRREGVLARSTTWDEKQDEAFISRIQDVLLVPSEPDNFGQKIPKLLIYDGNNGIITDIEQVQWARDKRLEENKPKLDITHKDYLACLKYALATNLNCDRGKKKPSYYTKNAYGINLKPKLR